jgi:hypothetical protein
MRRAIIVAAVLLGGVTGALLVADAASANEPVPDPIWRTVDSGADLVLSRPTFWNSACHPLGVTVTVTEPPANGTVTVTEGPNIANPHPRFGTAGRCGGTLIMGKQVIYRSKPGFHGTDYLVYHYLSQWGNRAEAHVNITVR